MVETTEVTKVLAAPRSAQVGIGQCGIAMPSAMMPVLDSVTLLPGAFAQGSKESVQSVHRRPACYPLDRSVSRRVVEHMKVNESGGDRKWGSQILHRM